MLDSKTRNSALVTALKYNLMFYIRADTVLIII